MRDRQDVGAAADGDRPLEAVAAVALGLAALDPAAARAMSTPLLRPARRMGAWDVVSTAERALGVAAMNLSELDDAIPHLRSAVAAGRRTGSRRIVGEARMSLASALVLRGRPAQAAREIETAVRELEGVPAARAGVQHAAILQELGRDDASLEELRRALPILRRAGDAEWAVRGLSNRSLIHSGRRAYGAAEADLREALRLCAEHGLDLPAAYAEQNLGCVQARRGDVPSSLRHFEAAEECYRRYGLVEPSLFVDRAEVLLSVRLLEEARTTAEAAVAAYERQKRDVHVPEAHLLLSTVSLVQGDAEAAYANAEAAVREFRRLGRGNSLALARYARVQAMVAADARSVTPWEAARAAEELAAAGWTVPALEAWVVAGRLALDRGRRASARQHLSRASQARRAGPADARARAWLAEALLRQADGRRSAALSALRAGLRIVDDYQATLGATELRAHVSVHRGALARWGLRIAMEDRDPRRVLWWAERGRASALLLRPARPPADSALARDLADLRSTMADISEARSNGEDDGSLVRRQVWLERRIRDRSRMLDAGDTGHHGWHRGSLSSLVASLGDAALVEYVELDGVLHAVTVAGGRVRRHCLGSLDPVRRALAHVPFALHRLARSADALSARPGAASAVLEHAASTFDAVLVRPLATVLRDRPLVVVPSSTLQGLPWSLLPSCLGRPVTVSPSGALWLRAVGREGPGPDAPVVVVAGPGLPGAATEAATIAGLYRRSTLLLGDRATAADLTATAVGAAMLHVAAHGSLRSDNPLFSSLTLADGPLTVYELEWLARPPHHVVLASCDVGRPHQVTGEEILGFGAALLAAGTATVVAPVVSVPDTATVPVMSSYHEGLIGGLPPAEAMARAQAKIDRLDPAAWAAAAGFVCMGAGQLG